MMVIEQIEPLAYALGGGFGFIWTYYRLMRGAGIRIGITLGILFGFFVYLGDSAGNFIAVTALVVGVFSEIWHQTQPKEYSYSHLVFEGGGIRRGLEPLEVGVLFELPHSTLFVLGLVKLLENGVVGYRLLSDGAIIVSPLDEFLAIKNVPNPILRREARKERAYKMGKRLTDTDDVLVEIFEQNENLSVGEYSIQVWVDFLKRQVNQRVNGYDFAQTKNYYIDFISHRLSGVKNEYFSPFEYLNWAILSLYLGNQYFTNGSQIINETHPAWIGEGESFKDWFNLVKSVSW